MRPELNFWPDGMLELCADKGSLNGFTLIPYPTRDRLLKKNWGHNKRSENLSHL